MAESGNRFHWKPHKAQSSGKTIMLPCKIGDSVWAIRSSHGIKRPQQGVVSDMFFMGNMELHIAVKYVACGQWGKTVFATKEDAEKAIGGNSN